MERPNLERPVLDTALNTRITAAMDRDLNRRAVAEDRSKGHIVRAAIARYLASEAA